MTRSDANEVIDLARSGSPIPDGVMAVALYVTGDADSPPWDDWLDASYFVHALKQEQLLERAL